MLMMGCPSKSTIWDFHRISKSHWERAFVVGLRPSAQPLSKQRVLHTGAGGAWERCTVWEWRLREYWQRSWD